jgi:hypothetical protein
MKFCSIVLILYVRIAFRKEMFRLHLRGISAGIANSVTYFLYMANFAYGNKLVEDGEMTFDQVIR